MAQKRWAIEVVVVVIMVDPFIKGLSVVRGVVELVNGRASKC